MTEQTTTSPSVGDSVVTDSPMFVKYGVVVGFRTVEGRYVGGNAVVSPTWMSGADYVMVRWEDSDRVDQVGAEVFTAGRVKVVS